MKMKMGMMNEKMEMRKGMEPHSGMDKEDAKDMAMGGSAMKMKAPFPAPAPSGSSSSSGGKSKGKKWIGGIAMQH